MPSMPLQSTSRFLSTPSARRATQRFQRHDQRRVISIHALCEEGDRLTASSPTRSVYFYPRPLRGGRLSPTQRIEYIGLFLSTPSARRATVLESSGITPQFISIHALCEEGDLDELTAAYDKAYISIHALCEEGDRLCRRERNPGDISIHALCEEGDHVRRCHGGHDWYFYPRPLRGGRRRSWTVTALS